MSCGGDCRHGLDLVLLWLWCRPAATAPIQPLAWELPYAAGVALKKHTHTHTKVLQWTEIIPSLFFGHNRIKLIKKIYIWKNLQLLGE